MSEKEQLSEYRKEWLLEVLKLLYGRRDHLNETLHLTREIGESLDRNDRVSVQMLFEMRGKELEAIGENIRRLQLFKEQLTGEAQVEIDQLLEGEAEARDDFSRKVADTVKSCKILFDEIIAIDKRMSKRIAGSDSFYK